MRRCVHSPHLACVPVTAASNRERVVRSQKPPTDHCGVVCTKCSACGVGESRRRWWGRPRSCSPRPPFPSVALRPPSIPWAFSPPLARLFPVLPPHPPMTRPRPSPHRTPLFSPSSLHSFLPSAPLSLPSSLPLFLLFVFSLCLLSRLPLTSPAGSDPSLPPNHVILYSWSDEWGKRSPDRWKLCAADQLTCQITWNSTLERLSSALLLHAPDHSNDQMPPELLHDHQRRPLYYFTDEAPPWFAAQPFLSNFDLISTYDLLSDAPRPYILGPDLLSLMRAKGQQALVEGTHEELMANLTAKLARAREAGLAPIAWLVSNCGADRSFYVAELMKYIPVDIYGSAHCLGSNLTLPGRNDENKEPENELLKSSYFFYLSLENHNCRDYVTEKLFRPLNTGVVPIVDGPSDYGPFLPTARSALRLDDYESPAQLALHIGHLLRHLEEYAVFLNFSVLSSEFVQANDRNFDGWCLMCEHAYRAKTQIKAMGNYMRSPSRYRLSQLQLCVHDKWQVRYSNNVTAMVTSSQSPQYAGPKVNAEVWWTEWALQANAKFTMGTKHQWPHPHSSTQGMCDPPHVESAGTAIMALALFEGIILMAVAIRWTWRPRVLLHRRRDP